MNTLLRIFHPLFSWAFFLIYGLEQIEEKMYLPTIIIILGLAGWSQTFWKTQFSKKKPYMTGDIIAFCLGLIPAIVYPIMTIWTL
ncbi:hypothetical protein [Undibacterium baiyunense]|uniref:Uncharacterized protein n=1 Tax=Undibacterium baiyunense TaxID=2828731 RepID=A0A941I212_9BURK|nr:hypothetical protein [Undibacterium baiyunense]MBR7745822.1 hypothetical protein [Undibacterium baiyunense]